MTKWQLPQGVEYPIDIRFLRLDMTGNKSYSYANIQLRASNEIGLNNIISNYEFRNAHSIRINNSIDLVKIEE